MDDSFSDVVDVDVDYVTELLQLPPGIDPAQPTPTQPGSLQKMQVLAARAELELPMHHAHDNRDCVIRNETSRHWLRDRLREIRNARRRTDC